MRKYRFSIAAMLERVSPEPNSGCWLYLRALNNSGYGPHRTYYERFRGPIPDGLTLDHLCRIRCCVNPDHLEPMPLRENILRGEGTSARHARRDACLRGHPYTPGNIGWSMDSKAGRKYRYCKTCNNALAAINRAKPGARERAVEYARQLRARQRVRNP